MIRCIFTSSIRCVLCDFVSVWKLRLLQKKWITRVSRLCIVLCNVTKEAFQCLYLRLKNWLYYLIGANFNYFDTFGQFIAPNRRTIEEPKEVLTFNLCQTIIHFFNRVYDSWRRFCVRCTKFSLELSPALHMFQSHMKQNYF